MPDRLLLIAIAVALPSIADAACQRVFGLVCDSPFVVADVTLVEAGRTWLTVTQSVGDGAPPVGETITLTTLDTDRRRDRLVVSEGFRQGEVFDGVFNHFGAEVRVDELETLRADPVGCEEELIRRGAEPPDCDDVRTGCASAPSGWLSMLVIGLFRLLKTSRSGPDGCSGFRDTFRAPSNAFRKLQAPIRAPSNAFWKLQDPIRTPSNASWKLQDPIRAPSNASWKIQGI